MSRTYSVIDTDIHPVLQPQRVIDFLPEPWRTRYAKGERYREPGPLGYWNPIDVMRSDTLLPDGSRIETSPQNLARHFFDVYDLEYGLLNPMAALHVGLSPEPDFAAASISAHNDIIVHDWLNVDSRFRASLVVSPADPELAAREIHRLGEHPGYVQVLMTCISRIPYGQRFYHPIYAAAVEHHLPVAIHPSKEGGGISGPHTHQLKDSVVEWY